MNGKPTTRGAVCAVGPGLLLTLLMPKCPLCVAAVLSSLGIGGALASKLAPYLHSAALIALALPMVVLAILFVRARRRACTCDQGGSRFTSQKPSSPQTSRSDNRPGQPQTSAS